MHRSLASLLTVFLLLGVMTPAPQAVAQRYQAYLDYESLMRRASREFDREQYQEAADLYARAAESAEQIDDSGDSQALALIGLGEAHSYLDQLDEAAEVLEQALAIARSNYRRDANALHLAAYEGLVGVYLMQERADEAEDLTRRWIDLITDDLGEDDPELISALDYWARLLLYRDEVDDAIDAIRQAIDLAEADAGASVVDQAFRQSWLGAILGAQLRYDESLAVLRRAESSYVQLAGEDNLLAVAVRASIGRTLVDLGRTEEGIQTIDEVVDTLAEVDDPIWSSFTFEAWLDACSAFGSVGQYERAEAAARAALEIDPESSWAARSLSQSYFDRGLWSQAAERYTEAIELDPNEDFLRCRRYVSLALSGRTQEATEQLRTYLDEERDVEQVDEPEWTGQLVAVLLKDITPEQLLEHAEAGQDKMQRRQRYCEASFYIGQRLLIDGRVEAARPWFESCVATGVLNFTEHGSSEAILAAWPPGR